MLGYWKNKLTIIFITSQVLVAQEKSKKVDENLKFYFGALDEAPKSDARAELGHQLFFDKRLSASGKVACVDCHTLSKAGTNRQLVKSLKAEGRFFRDIPTVFNVAQLDLYTWEGKPIKIHEKIADSMNSEHEMGKGTWEQRMARLAPYEAHFKSAYPELGLTQENIKVSLTEYMKQLVAPAPFDAYIKGDASALTADQVKGLEVFNEKKCASCHTGKNFGGQMIQKMGSAKPWPNRKDLGHFYTSDNEEHKMFFRVSPLRNVILTKPYFHDASSNHILDAIRKMGEYVADTNIDKDSSLEIYSFLKSLSGELPEKWVTDPVLP